MSRSDDQTTGATPGGPSEEAAAYALGALSADEARAFETQLGESPQLRDEVSPLIDTAATLGLAVPPVQPSAGMKEALMARIAVTPQLPALNATAAPAANTAADARGAHLAPVAPLATGVPEEPAHAAPATPAHSAEQAPIPMSGLAADRARARWFSRPGAIVAAAAAAVALFFGGALAADVVRPGGDVAQQTLAQVVAAPDATVLTSAVEGGASASLISSQELGVSVMVFDGLEQLSAEEAYALWYITDGEATPAGLFSVDAEGTVVQVLDGEFVAGTVVGVTVEPASGSPAPTTTPIVAIATA